MSLPPVYLAMINTPGYLPMDDDPPVFDTPQEAWQYLHGERKAEEDRLEDVLDYSDTVSRLLHMARGGKLRSSLNVNADDEGVGYMHAPSPDPSPHDLGVAYSVTRIDHADYPHHPGYLHDCRACEIRCHCTPGSAECVYGGDHD